MDIAAIKGIEPVMAQASQQAAAARPSAQDLAVQRQVIQAVRAVNESQSLGTDRELTFAMDRESRRVVVRLVDKTTREVLLQIPNEQVLRLMQGIDSAEEE